MDIPENSINEIFENSPSQGTLYVLLNNMKENGRYDLVISECLKALSRFSKDLTLRKILAEAYLGAGQLIEAEAEFSRVMNGMKALADVYKSQAEIYVRQKREDDAVESLKLYLTFFPEDEDASILLEELQATKEFAPVELPEERIAEDIFETEETVEADVAEIQETIDEGIIESEEQEELTEIITASLAETYFEQGELAEAREIYEKMIERAPEDVALKTRLDEISALMEQKEEPEELKIEDSVRRKKERMISILDSWRNNIRNLAGDSTPL